MIRLIASDLDGTLLQNGAQTLPEEVFPLIRELRQKGVFFAASSGRQYANLRRLFAPVHDQIGYICENGALNVLDGRVLSTAYLENDMAREIARDLEGFGCHLLLSAPDASVLLENDKEYTDSVIYNVRNTCVITDAPFDIGERYIKVSGYFPGEMAPITEKMKKKWQGKANVTPGGLHWLDLSLTTKADGIAALEKAMGVDRSEVLAFGDHYNDVVMLDVVGQPRIMQNAPADLLNRYPVHTKNVCDDLRQIIANL